MRKLNVSIIAGVVVAVFGAGIVMAYGQSVGKHASAGKGAVSVLVADSDLSAGTTAADVSKHVHVAKVPSAYVVSGALSSMSQLTSDLAKDAVLTGTVTRGGQLASANFANTATAGHVKAAAGHVAISVETDLSPGVARYLSVGSKVDVFATYHDVRDQQGKLTAASSRTKLFATGVKVLAVSVASAPANGGNSSDMESLTDKVVVLLDMAPTDAEKLVNAATLGDIYLADSDGRDTTPTGAVPDNVVAANR